MSRDTLVMVGVPSLGEWKARTGVSLAMMCASALAKGDKDISLTSVVGSILPNQRLDVIKQARQINATHLLFVDADMVFPHNLLDVWLGYGVDVVAANCPIKQVPSQSTARVWRDGRWTPVYTLPNSEGLEQIDRIGTGIMLLRMSVFDRIAQPYFEMRWAPEMDGYQGEDWCFCEKLEAAGVPIYIDHTISKEVLHVGDFAYSHKHIKPELVKAGNEQHRRNLSGG